MAMTDRTYQRLESALTHLERAERAIHNAFHNAKPGECQKETRDALRDAEMILDSTRHMLTRRHLVESCDRDDAYLAARGGPTIPTTA